MSLPAEDAAFLLGRVEFRRFLNAAIQAAGLLGHHGMAGSTQEGPLAFLEGRRSLCLDLVALAHRVQGEATRQRDPLGLTTIQAVIQTALSAKDIRLERPASLTRYDELPVEPGDGPDDGPVCGPDPDRRSRTG